MALENVGTFRFTNSSLDRHSERVIASGGVVPKEIIMLYNHHRARSWDDGESKKLLAIGRWKDIRLVNDEWLGDAYVDMGDPFAAEIGRKIKIGVLTDCSIGFKVLSWSDDPKDKVQGQKGLTILTWELLENSIVDIGSNPDAHILSKMIGEKSNSPEIKQKIQSEIFHKTGSLVQTKADPAIKPTATDTPPVKEKKDTPKPENKINSKNKNLSNMNFLKKFFEKNNVTIPDDATPEQLNDAAKKAIEADETKDILKAAIAEGMKPVTDQLKTVTDQLKAANDEIEKLKSNGSANDNEKAKEVAKLKAEIKKNADAQKALEKQLADIEGQSDITANDLGPDGEGLKKAIEGEGSKAKALEIEIDTDNFMKFGKN